jgi:hypothetical protein
MPILQNKTQILEKIQKIINAYEEGLINSEKMPEDERPKLPSDSEELLRYLTLPMALNYQRNSFKLWENANKLFNDSKRSYLFNPNEVVKRDIETIRKDLLHYKVALQPNKHINTWLRLSESFHELYQGKVSNLLNQKDYNIEKILHEIQVANKKRFPYLSGEKIGNYWLYVLTQYTSLPFTEKGSLSIAPDTHVTQASIKLGIIDKQLPHKK